MSHNSDSSGRHRPPLDAIGRAVFTGAVLIVAWGVLAFGSPYPWAYLPLALGAGVVGIAGWFGTRPSVLLTDQRRLLLALALVIFAAALQLISWPARVVDTVSPANAIILRQIDLVFASMSAAVDVGAQSSMPSRPLSIDPGATARGLLLLASFSLLLAGLIRHCNRFGARRFAGWFMVFGVVVALIGIIQKAVLGDQAWDGMKIYGFWEPRYKLTTPFGPFVNKNHFAGWMLMALPTALGYLLAQAEIGMRNVRHGWRHRFLWLSSPEGGRLQIAAFAVVVMAVSLMMTLSRSGIACFGMAMAVAALAAVRRQRSTLARAAVVLAIGVLVAAPVLWANANVGERLATRNTSFALRKAIWSDAVRVMEDFPVVGTGFNTFAAAMRVYQTASDELMVLEAHNDYLQLAAEGGLLVGVPIVLTLVLFADGIRRRFWSGEDDPATSWIRFGAATAVAAIALQSVVEFSLQMPGNAVAFVVVAAIALHRPSSGQDSSTAVRPVVRVPFV